MASVKVKFRASSVMTKEGTLFYQVIHKRVVRQVSTGYRLYPDEWDKVNFQIVPLAVYDKERREYLIGLNGKVENDLSVFKDVIMRLENGGDYTTDNVVAQFRMLPDSKGFISFARSLIFDLIESGKTLTAEKYTTVINSFERFVGGSGDLSFDRMDVDMMIKYETYLKRCGICPNSSSFYMRGLRAVYNRAVARGLTVQRKPFKYVYTGIDKTVKRALPLYMIRKIRNMELATEPALDYARDIFMFSFYTRGMSFIDMAYLKKSDLKNGILSYRRQKTGQRLTIRWEQPMQSFVEKYRTEDTQYLLPIIKDETGDVRKQYRTAAHLINCRLKILGQRLDLTMPLTMYVARHGWASIAWSKHIPISTISEAMGHDSEATTRIYLASLDTSAIDRANSLILNSL